MIGLIQPLGSIMPMAELQARVFCSVVTGAIKLPSEAAMKRSIEERRMKVSKRYLDRPRHTIQVTLQHLCSRGGRASTHALT